MYIFQNNKTNISISIMLVIELGSCYLELKLEMMETQRIKMDENRSVLVWDWNLPVSFGPVPVPFLYDFETGVVLLELGSPGSGLDRFWPWSTVWGDGLRDGTEEGDSSSQAA